MDEAIATPALAGHNRPRNPGVPLATRLVRERRRQRQRGRAAGRDADDPPFGQEGISGRLAREGDDLHRSHDALRRRHARARAPALRQGAPPAERRASRRARSCRPRPDGRRGLRLPDHGRSRGQGARGLGDSGRLGRDRLSRRAHALEAAARRDPLRGLPRARARSTSSSPARTCSAATGARSTTRSRRCAKPAAARI